MKIYFTIQTFLILILTTFTSNSQSTFQKMFASTGFNGANDLKKTSDGGYIVTGFINDDITGNTDVLLMKLNGTGDTLWTRRYGGVDEDGGRAVQQTTDGGYIINCYAGSFGEQEYLIKTDSNGSLLWSKTFGDASQEEGQSVAQTFDGGYIILGAIFGSNSGILLIRTDANGDTLWCRKSDSPYRAYSILPTSDSGFVLTGYGEFPSTSSGDMFLVKLNANGDTLWTKTYGSNGGMESGNCVKQARDGGYIIAGYCTFSFGSNTEDVYVVKTDALGNLQWSRTYGDSLIYDQSAYSIEQTNDDGYVFAGINKIQINDTIYVQALVIKADRDGILQWSKTYGTSGFDGARSIQEDNDRGYIFTGYTTSINTPSTLGIYLVKTDANGISGCNDSNVTITDLPVNSITGNAFNLIPTPVTLGNPNTIIKSGLTYSTICSSIGIDELSDDTFISIFPNPSNGNFSIVFTDKYLSGTIKTYDAMASIVFQENFSDKNPVNLDFSNLNSGIYFITITTGNNRICRKVIINHELDATK
jgi:hypothetical protein